MPAMPHTEYDRDGNMPRGLTKREYFAGLAMQGLLAGAFSGYLKQRDCVNIAVQHADGLLEELERTK